MTGEGGASDRDLEEQFGGDVEAEAEAPNVFLVEVALAAENLGDDAGRAEDVGEVLLQEAVLVHEELEDFERLGAGKLVVAALEILDQEECIESIQKYRISPRGVLSCSMERGVNFK